MRDTEPSASPRRRRLAVAGGVTTLVALAAVGGVSGTGARADGTVAFSAHYVSTSLGGGEPYVIYSHGGKDLVYSSHEGTTHIDKNYVTTPGSSCDVKTASGFVCSYDNQVNNWYSTDAGLTWNRSVANPLYTGFSDPSLAEDASNDIWNTGIDLANDALFVSQDGGKTWVAGTPQCHNGDRPWLAGGKAGEVFLGTDTEESGHEVFKGTVTQQTTPAGNVQVTVTCSAQGIVDGAAAAVTRIGSPMAYDANTGDLIEPARSSSGGDHVGLAVLAKASDAFTATSATGSFQTRIDKLFSTTFGDAIGPRIAVSPAADNTIYEVWATGPRNRAGTTGCSGPTSLGGAPPLPQSIMLTWTADEGQTWAPPVAVASPQSTGGNDVIWPWVAAGPNGDISVVWYQSDQLTDPDCDSASLMTGGRPTKWTLQVADILGATNAATAYPAAAVNAVPNWDSLHPGGVLHVGGICQSGTTCAATGQDRRLGDYFTNALDQNGCVIIATADTQLTDQTAPPTSGQQFSTGRPLFVHQVSGASLTNPSLDCASFAPPSASAPETRSVVGLIAVGAAVLGVLAARRRRRTRPAAA